jgi:hypothetical protein
MLEIAAKVKAKVTTGIFHVPADNPQQFLVG